jgi:hypothetical protein
MKLNCKSIFWVISIAILVVVSLYFGYPLARRSAIQHAISQCAGFYGVQVVPPRVVQVELTTFDRAEQLLYPGDLNYRIQWRPFDGLGPIVWAVELKGDWILLGGPAPLLDPTKPPPGPAHIDECKIMIDVFTGVTDKEGMIE